MPQTPIKKRSKRNRRRAYGYVRVSTEEQSLEGISLDLQRTKIRAYADLHDLELVEILSDEGASGKSMEREGLQGLLELVKGGQAESLIVYKLDRLTRSTRDLLWLVEDFFVSSGTQFLSITEEINTDSAMGRFFITIMGALAQMERELISERTKAALGQKKLNGEFLGGPALGELVVSKGKRQAVPKELEVVKEIKRRRRRGESYHKIAGVLNERGIPTKRGGKWHGATVRYIALNPKYHDIKGR